jgi:CheY-like chemotaxis protein
MLTKKRIKKVLIVDDNEDMARCLADMVDFFGIPSQTACDGNEAIELLKKSDFSLIIADSIMPKVSGFTLLKYVKKYYPKIPVAIISTRDSEVTQGMVVRDKPDFYLPKPFTTANIETLLRQIK